MPLEHVLCGGDKVAWWRQTMRTRVRRGRCMTTERRVYQNDRIRVFLTDLELPDGARFGRHVVKVKPAAVIVLRGDDELVLMLWRHRSCLTAGRGSRPATWWTTAPDPETTAGRQP